MEEERLVSERSRQYGSCGRRSSAAAAAATGPLVRHVVQRGDTLQGLALKYRTTTEKIRRANRLFATESLFIREYLMIPVPKDIADELPPECLSPKAEPIAHRASVSGGSTSAVTPRSDDFPYGSPDEKKTFDEFLSRVDSSLASIKKDVKKTSEKSEFGKYAAELYTRKRPTSRLRQSASVGGVGTSPMVTVLDGDANSYHNANSYHSANPTTGMGETVVLADGRHVRSSLQRLQRAQDDWFQL